MREKPIWTINRRTQAQLEMGLKPAYQLILEGDTVQEIAEAYREAMDYFKGATDGRR